MNEEGPDSYTTPTVIQSNQPVSCLKLKKGISIESYRYHMHYETTTTLEKTWPQKNCINYFIFHLLVSDQLSCMDFGGTCTRGPGLGKFSCQCKAQVTVLPFIDNRCNVIELYIKVIKNNQCH